MAEFNYRRAIEELCFLNVPLLSLSEITNAADQRELLFFSLVKREIWETMDREGLLSPVGFIATPSVSGGEGEALKEGYFELREEHDFRPWEELGEPRFSRWQLLGLFQLASLIQLDYPVSRLEHGLKETAEWLRRLAEAIESKKAFEGCSESWRRTDLLLIRVQNLLVPQITGHYRSPAFVSELGDQDPFEWTREQQRTFDYEAAAEECRVTAEGLAELYERLVTAGQRIDPILPWFDLADQVKRQQLEKLRGHALIARDYYLAARLIRGWHARVGEADTLPDINEVRHGAEDTQAYQERIYGQAEIRQNQAALPGLLEHFGLYPWRVQLLPEGPSEKRILDAIFRGWWRGDLATYGIHTVSLGGAGVPKKTDQVLSAVRTYANYYFLLLDREGKAAKLVHELSKRGEIEVAAESRLWEASMEADNFTIDELCAEIESWAAEAGVTDFSLDRDEVLRRYQSNQKALAEVIKIMSEEERFPFAKPDLAERLGHLAMREQEFEGKRRPILEVAESLLRLSRADRRLKGRLRGEE